MERLAEQEGRGGREEEAPPRWKVASVHFDDWIEPQHRSPVRRTIPVSRCRKSRVYSSLRWTIDSRVTVALRVTDVRRSNRWKRREQELKAKLSLLMIGRAAASCRFQRVFNGENRRNLSVLSISRERFISRETAKFLEGSGGERWKTVARLNTSWPAKVDSPARSNLTCEWSMRSNP